MIVIGLTGSIGTGKSTVTQQFALCGAATLDSDKVVHGLLGSGGEAVAAVAQLFPSSQDHDKIDRKIVGALVFGNPGKLAKLEAIVHPLVRKAQEHFIKQAWIAGRKIAVLDIPLLFETEGEKRCDVTVVTTAPAFIQRQRVFKRVGMTEEKFTSILAAQMPDREKRKRGDFIVHTGLGRAESLLQVKQIVALLNRRCD